MKLALSVLAASALSLAGAVYADTTSSDKGKAVMEHKASPSASKSDEERAEASQGQPNVPYPGGTAPRTTQKADTKSKAASPGKAKKNKESSSSGSSAPTGALPPEKEQAFKDLDIDGDGAISKAEAAGHAEVMTNFDRADRNHDGKLSRAEYLNLGKGRTRTARADAKR